MKTLLSLTQRALAAVVVVLLATPLWAQTMHSGERSDDFTGIRRNMLPLPIEPCPDNQIAVGSNCVDLPVTQTQDGDG